MRLQPENVFVLTLLSLQIASPADSQSRCDLTFPAPAAAYRATKNLTYEVAPDGQIEQLDLYMPTQSSNPPLTVEIHGGGFVSGDKSTVASQAAVLANNGIAVANVNYRLSTATSNQFPGAVQDVRCAVQWLRSQAGVYGYAADRVGAIGYSAGGTLAAMLGTAGHSHGSLDSPTCSALQFSPAVDAVASYYGVYDFALTTGSVKYLGGSPSGNPLTAPASPLTYVDASCPPFIMVRGSDDLGINPDQQDDMVSVLKAANVPVQAYTLDGLGHGFNPFNIAVYPVAEQSSCATIAFFAAHL